MDLAKAGQTDNVHDTVSYADVYRYGFADKQASRLLTLRLAYCLHSSLLLIYLSRHIKTVVEGRPHKLLESVADRLANEILNDYHQVQGMQLHIKKPHVAVSGVVESLGKFTTSPCVTSFGHS